MITLFQKGVIAGKCEILYNMSTNVKNVSKNRLRARAIVKNDNGF